MDVLLEHIASGSVKIPAHCELNINGMLSMSTLTESYEHSEALPTATAGPDSDEADNMDEQLEYGKGKRRQTANRQYDAFWSH